MPGGPQTPRDGGSSDPGLTGSWEQFVVALAELRVLREVGYQSLQRRTGVPRSTLHDMLTLRRRSRTEVVHAVIEVFATDEGEATTWKRRWAQLQLAQRQPALAGDTAAVELPVDPPRKTAARAPVLLVAVLLAVITAGASVLVLRTYRAGGHPATGGSSPAAAVTLRVFNVEGACQPLRTMECALGLTRDPQLPGTLGNRLSRVWHGDTLTASCVATGRLITDEQGMSSDRWYRVTVPGTSEVGWLPGIRTRNTQELPRCSPP